jgi:hypothetical protein
MFLKTIFGSASFFPGGLPLWMPPSTESINNERMATSLFLQPPAGVGIVVLHSFARSVVLAEAIFILKKSVSDCM